MKRIKLLAINLSIFLTACVSYESGTLNDTSVKKIIEGQSREDVRGILGTPNAGVSRDIAMIRAHLDQGGFDASELDNNKRYLYWGYMNIRARAGAIKAKTQKVNGAVLFHNGMVEKAYYYSDQFR